MGKVYVYGTKDKVPEDVEIINTTSRSMNWSKGLSPFFLVPTDWKAHNIENYWQYTKCYKIHTDEDGNPNNDFYEWQRKGLNTKRAVRYPMGKGAKPLYSFWNGEKLDYITARKRIYFPIYSNSVKRTEAYSILYEIYKSEGEVHLWDFDGYDYLKLGMTLSDVLNDEKRKMGHAFCLAALLKNDVKPTFVKKIS